MITLQKVRFKNFLSYGNKFTEYNFTRGITRITGLNGHGKSVIVDVINYSLFGKPFRKSTLPNLVNTTNKRKLVTEIYFECDSKNYKIVRGIKPNRFEIYCGPENELLNQDSHKKDYQKYLEDEVFKFNESIFHQTVIKSLTKYESFLTLPKNKKRHIIEELFEITVISEMFEINKFKKTDLESRLYDLKINLNHKNEMIEQELSNIEKLKTIQKQLKEESEEEKIKINETISSLEFVIDELLTGLKLIKKYENANKIAVKEYDLLLNNLNNLNRKKSDIETKLRVFKEKIVWLKTQCPVCLRVDEIELDDKDANIDKKESINLDEQIIKLNKKIVKLNKKIEDNKTIINKKTLFNQKINNNRKQIVELNGKIKKIKKDFEVDESKYESLIHEFKYIDKKCKNTENDLKYVDVIYNLLQDEGIKAYIIKKYLPLLNKLLNTYLQKFALDFELEFTYNFDVDIKNKFKNNLTYENFSQGEKKRVDASVMFCFLEFCKLKYNTAKINLLAFDEFTVGLDPEGESTFYEILKDISKRDEVEIITVSHSSLIDPDKIDNIYSAEVRSGFSNLTKIDES